MTKCIWCTREFEKHPGKCKSYDLLNAGIKICWDCADSYTTALIKVRAGKMRAIFAAGGLQTDNGAQLPFKLEMGHKGLLTTKVSAVDSDGHRWHGRLRKNLVTLRP